MDRLVTFVFPPWFFPLFLYFFSLPSFWLKRFVEKKGVRQVLSIGSWWELWPRPNHDVELFACRWRCLKGRLMGGRYCRHREKLQGKMNAICRLSR